MQMAQEQARKRTRLLPQTSARPGFERAAPDPANRVEADRNSELETVPEVGGQLAFDQLAAIGLEPAAAAEGQPALAQPLALALIGTLVGSPLALAQRVAAVELVADFGTVTEAVGRTAAVGGTPEAAAAAEPSPGLVRVLELIAAIAVEPVPAAAGLVGQLPGAFVEPETEALEPLPARPQT